MAQVNYDPVTPWTSADPPTCQHVPNDDSSWNMVIHILSYWSYSQDERVCLIPYAIWDMLMYIEIPYHESQGRPTTGCTSRVFFLCLETCNWAQVDVPRFVKLVNTTKTCHGKDEVLKGHEATRPRVAHVLNLWLWRFGGLTRAIVLYSSY